MGTISPGLVSITFRQLTPNEIVRLLEKADVRAVEWGGDVHVPHGDIERAREVRDLCSNSGVVTPSYGSYYRLGVSAREGLRFETVLETASELGCETVRAWAGNRSSEAVSAEDRAALVVEARKCADLARSAGLTISFEYHGCTLTDTNESATRFFDEVDHPAVRSYWQPRNGKPVDYSLEGLHQVAPYLSNVHVFHWLTSQQRFALAEGAGAWARYLQAVGSIPGDRYAMIEFVKGDAPEQFLADAATLKAWLA
ncbi:MAG: sugar phosphate isomerase/epimerase family protein [Spirochaetota bacterium]